MRDNETGSQWSQLRGEAIEGEMKGSQLTFLPATMTSWESWLREHPNTTVLKLSRTSQNYDAGFYERDEGPRRSDPDRFCIGGSINGQAFHSVLNELKKSPVVNAEVSGQPVVIVFDSESTSTRIFSRHIDDKAHRFLPDPKIEDRMRDEATNSLWNRLTGIAVEGELKGVELEHQVGIMSFTRKWIDLHPDSLPIPPPKTGE